MSPHVHELDAGARYKIFHGPRHQNARRLRIRHDPSADIDGDPADVVAHHFAFARVDAGAHVNAELLDSATDCNRASNCAGRTIEGCQKAIARGVGFLAAKARQLLTDDRVVGVEQIPPRRIAERCSAFR